MSTKNFHEASSDVLKAVEVELNTLMDEAAVCKNYIDSNPGANPEQAEARFNEVLTDFIAVITDAHPTPNLHLKSMNSSLT